MSSKAMNIPKGAKHTEARATFTLDIDHTETAVILALIDYNEKEQFGNDAMEQRMRELEKRINQQEQKMREDEKISRLNNSALQSKLHSVTEENQKRKQ
jgi:thiamine biosynthesis lipoprotein ApbE